MSSRVSYGNWQDELTDDEQYILGRYRTYDHSKYKPNLVGDKAFSHLPDWRHLTDNSTGKGFFGNLWDATKNNLAYEYDESWRTLRAPLMQADDTTEGLGRVAKLGGGIGTKALNVLQLAEAPIDFGMNIAAGMDPVDAVVDTGTGLAGGYAGATLGAAIGSPLGPIGTAAGYIIGGMAGDWLARSGKNAIFGDPMEKVQRKKMREEQVRQMDEERKRRMQEMYGQGYGGSRRDLYQGYENPYAFSY